MTYKALTFFDLDGTLLDEHSQITSEITEAMAMLRKNQVLPIIATGRTEPEVTAIREAAGITSNIVMNGAFIRIDGKEVFSDTLEPELCARMFQAVKDNGDELCYYNEKGYWATGHTEEMIGAYNYVRSPLPEIDPLHYETDRTNMLLVLGVGNDAYYHERFPELTFYRNTPFSIDVVKAGTSKGTGVKTLVELLGLEDVPTFGFGDGSNDFALLEACDHKIAMGNGIQELKELADFVTLKNTEGGIVHALKHFDLI
ncbi:Cof-type HAD-IIB family hydrolase [Enterococcus casseliflavus]|uniref:Cof-type HAD-IIB family hydrolase n=1 Tax=Enterococcus casseliflavus TaxID=37734 RepID=UPI0035D905CE